MPELVVWDQFTPEQCIVIHAILAAPVASASVMALEEATHLIPLVIARVVTELIDLDWIELWAGEDNDGPRLVLSTMGAYRLQVHLEEGETFEVLRWHSDAATVRSFWPRRAADLARAAWWAEQPDHALDPRDMTEATEYLENLLAKEFPKLKGPRVAPCERLPNPSLCVGLGNPVYLPVDEFDRHNPSRKVCGKKGSEAIPENLQGDRVCKGCGGRDLASNEVCPRCQRWGCDGLYHRLARLGTQPRVERYKKA